MNSCQKLEKKKRATYEMTEKHIIHDGCSHDGTQHHEIEIGVSKQKNGYDKKNE
jgi:hypothetical protein